MFGPWKMKLIGTYKGKVTSTITYYVTNTVHKSERPITLYFYENKFKRREIKGLDKDTILTPELRIWLERKDASLPSYVHQF